MATKDPTAESVSFWEKLGDSLSGISETVSRLLLRIFGSSNERHVRKLGYIAPRKPTEPAQVVPGSVLANVNALEDKMKALSDAELAGLTPQFKERLAKGEKLNALLPEAFAACREAGRRMKNMRHYDVQIVGGGVLHEGNIAEMVTGEGKTLVATLPAYLNCLDGRGVHVVTVNDYLARRDCEWMLPIYRALGVSAGFIQSEMDPQARRKAYDCDITYGTNSEFGFDYLRDNMKPARWGDENYDPYYHQCQRALNYAIIDEVDNILIDEARTPLIISGSAYTDVKRYGQANDIAVRLTDLQRKGEGPYFEVNEKDHTCHLTDAGIHKAEDLAQVESFYTSDNMEWPHLIDNALKAHHLFRRDKEYAVLVDKETNQKIIVIIDEHTGRLMWGRQWSDGLHQAVEAKHAKDGVRIKEETQTLATVTLQNFFKLYNKLSGMTGTAMTEANEFWKIYKLDVIAIPTNKPLIRVEHPDLVYRSADARWNAVLEEVVEVNNTGRPILIGTTDVNKSLELSAMLKKRGIKHELLNALPEHAAREAEIVAQAGRIGAVTIATNMAGRGTDIILGGNPETMAWAKLSKEYASRLDVPEEKWKALVEEIEKKEGMREEGRKVAEMGGLHIIGTERHDARRIDNQLRGRAGRQGDPGSSRFYVSLQDDLMRIFGGEWVSNLLGKLGLGEDQAIESRMVSRRIKAAQKKVEERHFDARKHLLEYDEVMDTQRKQVYGYRQEILEGANCKLRILEMMDEQIDTAVDRYLDEDYGPASFAEFADKRLGVGFETGDFRRTNYEEAERLALGRALDQVETAVHDMIEESLGEEDPENWNWQDLAGKINSRWGLSTNERDLKRIGEVDSLKGLIKNREQNENALLRGISEVKDRLTVNLMERARKSVEAVDLKDGRDLLETNWGQKSLCDWAARKFMLKLTPEELEDKSAEELKDMLREQVRVLYKEKELTFPIQAAMTSFMAERGSRGGGQPRYDREGLYRWAQTRYPELAKGLSADDFRTWSKNKLVEVLLDLSKKSFPPIEEEEIDVKLNEVLGESIKVSAEQAKELSTWAKEKVGLEVPAEDLVDDTWGEAQQQLWDAYDLKYRPEMRKMERSLLLNQLDTAWKNHLLTMDHLRSAVNMMWVGQIDPKIEYKRLGMREHDKMWAGVQDKVTDTVFRMEEAEGIQETLWNITETIHEEAARFTPDEDVNQLATSGGGEKKKMEPIRNRDKRVGRNDLCPCGSGKKYKKCCMRTRA